MPRYSTAMHTIRGFAPSVAYGGNASAPQRGQLLPHLTRGKERAGHRIHLYLYPTKSLLIGTTMRHNHVVLLPDTV